MLRLELHSFLLGACTEQIYFRHYLIVAVYMDDITIGCDQEFLNQI